MHWNKRRWAVGVGCVMVLKFKRGRWTIETPRNERLRFWQVQNIRHLVKNNKKRTKDSWKPKHSLCNAHAQSDGEMKMPECNTFHFFSYLGRDVPEIGKWLCQVLLRPRARGTRLWCGLLGGLLHLWRRRRRSRWRRWCWCSVLLSAGRWGCASVRGLCGLSGSRFLSSRRITDIATSATERSWGIAGLRLAQRLHFGLLQCRLAWLFARSCRSAAAPRGTRRLRVFFGRTRLRFGTGRSSRHH